MEKPVCLICNDSEGQLCVVKEAKEILDGITQPVIVVSVVGLYRTGKSYLMNRLAGKQTGFDLGSTIESKTKGIWMWCIPHPIKTGHTLVLLDTEGLGDVHKGDEKHDTWIFCLAVLLSSTLVYNSLGVIDNNALEKLHYVTELTENIRVKAQRSGDNDDSAEFMRVFPSFIWTVRDFTLELKKNDKAITADEYLEGALELKTGSSSLIEKFNLPRRCLRGFFAKRRCFVFPRPAGDDDLARLEELSETDLDKRFLQRAKEFCSYVFGSAKPKTLTGGRMLIGSALGSLAEVYVEAIRSGQVPCLENAVESLAKIQNERAVEQGLQVYQSKVYESVCFPLDPSELSDIHRKAETAAIDIFISTSFNDAEQKAQLRLMEKIQNVYQELCGLNNEECLKVCKLELTRVFTPLEEAMNDGSFMCPGGYREYHYQLQSLSNEYRACTHKQLMSEEVLSRYLKEKDRFGKNILLADQCLTEAEQEKEVERLQKEVLEQENKSLEQMSKIKEQAFQDQQRTYEQHITQLMERMEKEMQRSREDNERVLEAKLREQKALLDEGFEERAELMNKEIQSLKGEIKNEDESKRSTLSKVVDGVGTAATLFLPGIIPKLAGFAASLFSRFL
ncbi:guanylate-binding protein 1 isoform X2 [Pangasianodon hypophthalmus]|nr:guanylate-binding protein 1 isoform X2 [Pangasianodon hypophthalmus]XP_034170572.2 guanylate-binding protein 1 isoform X2 [Pangasianodon hypophthalmus]XP_034170573.2 guanylate-binding protein 1 isoform X2 [Pangasianodon hypophthalmus]XP_053083567.1 guanylate-binding protein 1 isoform X2 [Pangasianodon hypophthalmus]